MYDGRIFGNGQKFRHPTDRCRECTCIDGTVRCTVKDCSGAGTCQHPVTLPGECCPVCGKDCLHEGRVVLNGGQYERRCQICACRGGNVHCSDKPCPPTDCTHPIMVGCCPKCSDCTENGVTYTNGAVFDHNKDPCQKCSCEDGSIKCVGPVCPSLRCTHPTKGRCCECDSCEIAGHIEVNGHQFLHPKNSCQECICQNGSVKCRDKQCAVVSCQNPSQDACGCPMCSDCRYQGRLVANGQSFTNMANPCQQCTCSFGSVSCWTTCPEVSCQHPLVDSCGCSVCTGCMYQGNQLTNGQMVLNLEDPCKECKCSQGTVTCLDKNCPVVSCQSPIEDTCGCRVCTGCNYNGNQLSNGQTFPSPVDSCKQCTCSFGSVTCTKKPCLTARCNHPSEDSCECPKCLNCRFQGKKLANAESVPDLSDPCKLCTCNYGEVTCDKKKCPKAICQHPSGDPCGCPVCGGCGYQGKQLADGQSFPHQENPCKLCTCNNGKVTCSTISCSLTCMHPVATHGCCPQCNDCLYEGQVRIQNQVFVSQYDPCRRCQCQQGTVKCETTHCAEAPCDSPTRIEGQCCPVCSSCVFLGLTYQEKQLFTHPEDPCRSCTCMAGNVTCDRKRCVVACSYPRREAGQCCPRCDGCSFEGHVYNNHQQFHPDPCRSCTCNDGNVYCEQKKCPVLTCADKIHVEGRCCEVCRGCTFKGILYEENETWVAPDDSCVTCTCQAGKVNCTTLQCYTPCSNPIKKPGQCCGECPSCSHEGHAYQEGESFIPARDPCGFCECAQGRLKCTRREPCSVSITCPPPKFIGPVPRICCTHCVESFSGGCNPAEQGQITRPRPNDPCFFCECTADNTWFCMKEECPPLNCPPDVQVHTPGNCCSSCPACFDERDSSYHHEGTQWRPANDPCRHCSCREGRVTCTSRHCRPLRCRSNERAITLEGQCCQSCQPLTNQSCFYQGVVYETGQNWTADECTTCRCKGPGVVCKVRSCPQVPCGGGETHVTVPGQCCPVCMKRPATCVVFGDPHYKTFDGAVFHFHGTCQYVMASDCGDAALFRVDVKHSKRHTHPKGSWVKSLTIYIAGAVIDLLQDRKVRVNQQPVKVPYLYEPHFLLEVSSRSLLLTTELGLRVLWDGSGYGEVTVPGSFMQNLCGLCGNFNGLPQDDMRTRSSHITNSSAHFGNSWIVKTDDINCVEGQDDDPCLAMGYRSRKIATTECAIIKSETFSKCHKDVAPEPYFTACVHDLCICSDSAHCLCDIVSAYARECARSGVKVNWRSSDYCAFECDASKGFIFDECGSACPRTCESIQTSGQNLTETCFKPCVPGCQCLPNQVLHDGRCIHPPDCPYIQSIPVL